MSLKLEVLVKPKRSVLESMNSYYNYDEDYLDHIRKLCAITIKQSTFDKVVEYLQSRGHIPRHNRIKLLMIIEKMLDIFASSGVSYWFIGEVLRDCICFNYLLPTTRHALVGVVGTHFK